MKRTIIMIVVATTMLACTKEGETDNVALRAKMLTLSKEIEALVETKCEGDVCTQQPSCGCEILAYGEKPCGGPWQYLVFSSSSTNQNLLTTKVNEYNTLNRLLNEQEGLISDCAFVDVPTVGCMANQCQSITL